MLLRSSPLLEFSPTALLIITLVGTTTAFFAATCGLVQNDLKRIIAFSTISQLGLLRNYIFIFTYILNFLLNIELNYIILHAFTFPFSIKFLNKRNNSTKNSLNLKSSKDRFLTIKKNFKYVDEFNDFNYNNRTIIKKKYNKIKGIYL